VKVWSDKYKIGALKINCDISLHLANRSPPMNVNTK
jgi:hypothetical protein